MDALKYEFLFLDTKKKTHGGRLFVEEWDGESSVWTTKKRILNEAGTKKKIKSR